MGRNRHSESAEAPGGPRESGRRILRAGLLHLEPEGPRCWGRVSGRRSHLHPPILSFAGGKGLGHQGTARGPAETARPSRAAWSP